MTEAHPTPHDELVAALVSQVQVLALASDRIGALFAGQHHLHTTDFRALTAIYRAERVGRPLTARQLADQLQISPGAVTYLVDRLAASGHVFRDADPTDRRRVLLRIGEHGREVAFAFFGPLGALAAMRVFRHKTQKAKFRLVPLFLCLHVGIVVLLLL